MYKSISYSSHTAAVVVKFDCLGDAASVDYGKLCSAEF